MGKLIDITGQKFGRLLVLEKSNKRNAAGQVYWKCLCDCGTISEICGSALRSGHTKSCGCYNYECNIQKGKNKIINRVGQKYGKLTVLERAENKDLKSCWKCKCECGNEIITTGDALQSGKTKSCGCLTTSFGEYKIEQLLNQANLSYEKEKTFSTCKSEYGKYFRFDFFVNNTYLIEFDGKQHFLKDAGWGEDITAIQKRDNIKNQWCKDNNIPLIRIPYTKVNELTQSDIILSTTRFLFTSNNEYIKLI